MVDHWNDREDKITWSNPIKKAEKLNYNIVLCFLPLLRLKKENQNEIIKIITCCNDCGIGSRLC